MVVGLVFLYLAIFLYGALLFPVAGLAIYASLRFQRRTAHALVGLFGWLVAAPIVGLVLCLVQDTEGARFGPSILLGYLLSSPLFLVPLGFRLFGARERGPLPA